MSTKSGVQKILDDALHLEPAARALVAETLLESLDLEQDYAVSQEWLDEIRRRCDKIDSGDIELLDGDGVIDKLRLSAAMQTE